MLVEQIGEALEPLSALAEPLVTQGWREVPAFVLFFGALFVLALPIWHFVVGLDRSKAAVLASCTMSSVHSALVALGGYEELLRWRGFHVDLPNSRPQKLLCEFSLAYMLADLLFYLLPFAPGDFVFIVHHLIAGVYLVGCLLTGHGAIGCILMFFMGEVTSPVFNSFTIAKELRHHSKAANRVFVLLSPVFTAAFVGVRSVVGPPIVAYFVYSLLRRATLLPHAWRVTMASCVSLGMLASQLWSYKLLRGFLRQHRRGSQLAAAKKAA